MSKRERNTSVDDTEGIPVPLIVRTIIHTNKRVENALAEDCKGALRDGL